MLRSAPMTLAQAIFLVASTIPAPYAPPPAAEAAQEARRAFLETLSVELASVAEEATCSGPWASYVECRRWWSGSPVELSAAVLAVGQHESLLSPRIQAGKCKVWGPGNVECDGVKMPDGSYYFRAQSAFQLQGHFREPVVGLEWWQVRNATKRAAWVLSHSRARCKTWEGMFSGYAGTRSCGWRGSVGRVKTFRSIEERLERALVRRD